MNNDKLDNLLKKWDGSLSPAFEKPEALKKRIMDKLGNRRPIQFDADRYFYVRKSHFYLAAAAAIAIVAAAVAIKIALTPSVSTAKEFVLEKNLLTDGDVEEAKKISAEVNKLFNNKVQCIVRSGNSMEITPAEDGGSATIQPKILIRQTVMRKSRDGWHKVFVADIITAPGERVMFNTENAEGSLWAFDTGSKVYAVDGAVSIKVNGENIKLSFCSGQEDRNSVVLKKIENTDSQYVVYQTICGI